MMSRSTEVAEAVGRAGETLEQRAERLRQVVSAPSEKDRAAAELAEVERQMTAQRETTGTAAAASRVIAIKRAWGGYETHRRTIESALQSLRDQLAAKIGEWNENFGAEQTLKRELDVLADRFGVETPNLPLPMPGLDMTLPLFAERTHRQPDLEDCEHGLRQRRTYAEVSGTAAHAIITAAGLKPFPPLTAAQQKAVDAQVDARARAAEQAELLKFEAARLPAPQGML
jgi:hypothetical protein